MKRFKSRSPNQPVTKEWLKERVVLDPIKGCWIWQMARSGRGYGTLSQNGKLRNAAAVAYELFKGKIPNGHQIRHTCDVKPCINPDHLITGTSHDNQMDSVERGLHRTIHGEKHPNSKLRNWQALEIRSSPIGCTTLSKIYGVSEHTIRQIRKGNRYADIEG